jgi:hypothetical protein
VLALGALELHLEAGLGATVFHRRQCPVVLGGEFVAVVGEQVCFEGVDEASEPDHLTFPQAMEKPSISALMRSMA